MIINNHQYDNHHDNDYDHHHDLRRGITESSPELADVLYQFPAHQQSKLLQVITVMMVVIGIMVVVVGDFLWGPPHPLQKTSKTIYYTFTGLL